MTWSDDIKAHMKLRQALKAHPICVSYWAAAVMLGLILQGWVPFL